MEGVGEKHLSDSNETAPAEVGFDFALDFELFTVGKPEEFLETLQGKFIGVVPLAQNDKGVEVVMFIFGKEGFAAEFIPNIRAA